MSLHKADVTARLRQFLERRSMPRFLENKPEAIKAEIDALASAVARHAPAGDALAGWWGEFEARVAGDNPTRSWPSEGEVRAAAMAGKPPIRNDRERSDEDQNAASLRINAARMEAGESVGDGFLYGKQAVALLSGGMVDQTTMRRYRSALYFATKEVMGEDLARRHERDWIARHEAAEAAFGEKTSRHAVAMPDKRKVDTGAFA